MINRAVRRLLPELAQKTLETMFFAMPDAVSTDPARPAGELIVSRLAFHGSPDGRFGLVISEAVARTLAANFTGCDESADLRADQIDSVIEELANMICGAVLSELESDANFDLDPPDAIHIGAGESCPDLSAGSPSTCRFEFSDGTLVLFLEFEGPV
jgi:CheY-specific phosphatase CheX